MKTATKKKKGAGSNTRNPHRAAPKGDLRDRLLLATLPHVGSEGWSAAALEQGALAAGVNVDKALALFPEPIDLVKHFTDWADRTMLAALKSEKRPERVRDRVGLAVQLRLEALAPYKAAVRQALATFAKPWNATEAARCLYGTCDGIWVYAGDTSTDYNRYTKRALLAGVYSATLLRWLADSSENHEATWHFLEKRLDNALTLSKVVGRFKSGPAPLQKAAARVKEKIRARRAA